MTTDTSDVIDIRAIIGPRVRPVLPSPRGPLSAWLLDVLEGRACPGGDHPHVRDLPIGDEDQTLSLYLLYELHDRGFRGVDDMLEWNAGLLSLRAKLEYQFLTAVRDEVGPFTVTSDVAEELRGLLDGDGPTLSGWCDRDGDVRHLREQAIHRSAYHLKEPDAHTWAIPRLSGAAKSALVSIQFDDYGRGVERESHASLFALHLDRLGLDPTYGAYLDVIPGTTLALTNLVSMFGLHRRWRGALVGHLALFEMAAVPVMGAWSAALRRRGFDHWTRLFHDAYAVADAGHQTVAAGLAAGLLAQEPDLVEDVVFGARALAALEQVVTLKTLAAWQMDASSLLRPVPEPQEAPGLTEGDGAREPRKKLLAARSMRP